MLRNVYRSKYTCATNLKLDTVDKVWFSIYRSITWCLAYVLMCTLHTLSHYSHTEITVTALNIPISPTNLRRMILGNICVLSFWSFHKTIRAIHPSIHRTCLLMSFDFERMNIGTFDLIWFDSIRMHTSVQVFAKYLQIFESNKSGPMMLDRFYFHFVRLANSFGSQFRSYLILINVSDQATQRLPTLDPIIFPLLPCAAHEHNCIIENGVRSMNE